MGRLRPHRTSSQGLPIANPSSAAAPQLPDESELSGRRARFRAPPSRVVTGLPGMAPAAAKEEAECMLDMATALTIGDRGGESRPCPHSADLARHLDAPPRLAEGLLT